MAILRTNIFHGLSLPPSISLHIALFCLSLSLIFSLYLSLFSSLSLFFFLYLSVPISTNAFALFLSPICLSFIPILRPLLKSPPMPLRAQDSIALCVQSLHLLKILTPLSPPLQLDGIHLDRVTGFFRMGAGHGFGPAGMGPGRGSMRGPGAGPGQALREDPLVAAIRKLNTAAAPAPAGSESGNNKKQRLSSSSFGSSMTGMAKGSMRGDGAGGNVGGDSDDETGLGSSLYNSYGFGMGGSGGVGGMGGGGGGGGASGEAYRAVHGAFEVTVLGLVLEMGISRDEVSNVTA